jgi:hypothetical protein
MKSLLAPVGCGLVVAAALYGLLSAAERRLPEPEDPWLDAFIAEGMKAEFRSISTEPKSGLMVWELRPQFEKDAAGTVLRNYLVQNTSVQLVRLTKADLLPDVAEGRKFDQKFKANTNGFHYCRAGRLIVFVAVSGKWIPIVGQMKTPKKDVEQIFDAFEETAKRYP